ncbi:MAG: NAD-dependent epimerase/dehydratase family protein [Myxococcales bacterium]|nr:NAD-dependent epimerase/dehydratase family protein [Myxococcales bacterium]
MTVASKLSGHRILLTGGAGFLASHLADALVEKNELVLFDTGFEGRPINYSGILSRKNVRAITGDILDAQQVRRAMEGCDTVVHMAAIVGVKKVHEHPKLTLETNFLGTRNVLEAVARPEKMHRVMYFSTSEVFGGMSFRVEEHQPASVGRVNDARWSYSASKLAGEHLAFAYHREDKLPVVIVRPFNVFGPRRTGDHAVLQFAVRALRGLPIDIHGDGSQIRSWCYVDDFTDALVRCLERDEAVGNDFNVGNPRNTCTILDLAQRVVSAVGSKCELHFSKPDFTDIDLRIPRLTKARSLLGFEPAWDLVRSLEETCRWYRDHLSEMPAV